jgi:hypothetical protein
VSEQDSDPKPTGKAETAPSEAKKDSGDRRSVSWPKTIVTMAAAIAAIGGAVTVIAQFTHWLDFAIHTSAATPAASCPSSTSVEVSPLLGISFYQAGQLDPMSLANNLTTPNPTVYVCMKSRPFELWFPALSSGSALEVCAADSSALFSSMFNPKTNVNCLLRGTDAADYAYAGGALGESTPNPLYPWTICSSFATCALVHYDIVDTRALPASAGDEKYYVSHYFTASRNIVQLTNQRSNLYLAIYLNRAFDGGRYKQPSLSSEEANTEFFVLSFK